MDEKTLTALKGSIAKWEAIVAGEGEDDGCDNCPLCQLFHPQYTNAASCGECPVRQQTGYSMCSGSPYDDYDSENHSEEAAQAELDFLRMLLPEAEMAVAVIAEERTDG